MYNARAFISFVLKTGDVRDPITRHPLSAAQHDLLCRMAEGPCAMPATAVRKLRDRGALGRIRDRRSADASLHTLVFDDAVSLFSETVDVARDDCVPVSSRLLQMSVVYFPRVRAQYGVVVQRDPDVRAALDAQYSSLLAGAGSLDRIVETVVQQFTVDLKRMGHDALSYVSQHVPDAQASPIGLVGLMSI